MNTLLFDTNVALWVLLDSPRLGSEARSSIGEQTTDGLISVVSVWEVAIKESMGKLTVPTDVWDVAEESGFRLIGITREDAEGVRDLPFHHRDPFDRLLISQARRLRVPLVASDRRFGEYDVRLVAADR